MGLTVGYDPSGQRFVTMSEFTFWLRVFVRPFGACAPSLWFLLLVTALSGVLRLELVLGDWGLFIGGCLFASNFRAKIFTTGF